MHHCDLCYKYADSFGFRRSSSSDINNASAAYFGKPDTWLKQQPSLPPRHGSSGNDPDLIFWGTGATDSWGDQWQSASAASVTQSLQSLSTTWHVNMLRIFIYPEWWMLNGASGTANGENVQNYVETLAYEAEQYGIYLDIVPYQLTACSGAFTSDPYLTPDQTTNQGLPMTSWDSAGQSYLHSTGLSEQAYWTAFWTSMATNLKAYPNVIFEAWNEPTTGSSSNTITSGYMTYLTTMYSAIRGAGSTNLIMMQWQAGWEPNSWGTNLSLGITNQHGTIKPNKHSLHNPLLLLRTIWPNLVLEQPITVWRRHINRKCTPTTWANHGR